MCFKQEGSVGGYFLQVYFQFWNASDCRFPDILEIDYFISVSHDVSQAFDLSPRYMRMHLPKIIGKFSSQFADIYNCHSNSPLGDVVLQKLYSRISFSQLIKQLPNTANKCRVSCQYSVVGYPGLNRLRPRRLRGFVIFNPRLSTKLRPILPQQKKTVRDKQLYRHTCGT